MGYKQKLSYPFNSPSQIFGFPFLYLEVWAKKETKIHNQQQQKKRLSPRPRQGEEGLKEHVLRVCAKSQHPSQ